jgi:hypothetical protein
VKHCCGRTCPYDDVNGKVGFCGTILSNDGTIPDDPPNEEYEPYPKIKQSFI